MKAIGWTLLHSIWQGLGIALLLALLLICLQRSSAAMRYFMATGAMLTFSILSLVTFVSEYRQATVLLHEKQTSALPASKAMGIPMELTFSSNIKSLPEAWSLHQLYPAFQAYFYQHLPLLVLLWGMGIMVLLIRFAGGYAYTQRLKNYKTVALPLDWQQTLHSLASAAQITQPVRLVESALIKIPMVIGYIKPVILLPVGTIIGLPAEQVEAILAHELAHIYRKDYLVNIFQCIIEILFFYHPGIWWISARIREEREHCCDDLALSICGNTLTFAKALANLEQITHHTPALAMGFSGKGNQLLIRIKRLGNTQVRKPDFMEGFLAACFVMLSISAISVSAGMHTEEATATTLKTAMQEVSQQEPSKADLPAISDTTKNTFTFKGTRNGKKYHIEAIMDNGEITGLTVNGNSIPSADIPQYQELIIELMGSVPAPIEPVSPVIAPTPLTPLTPEPAIAPNPVYPPDLQPATSGYLVQPPTAPHPALAPMVPEDISDLIRAAFYGDTSRKIKGDFVYNFTGNKNKTYKITIKNGELTELKVDGKKIPKEAYKDYTYLLDEIEVDAQARQMELLARQEEAIARQREQMDRQINHQREMIERTRAAREKELEALNLRQQKEFQMQERNFELQMKAQEEAMRKQEATMEKAMKQHDLAMIEHEKAMEKHEESAKLSKMLIATLNEQLLQDKLIQKDKTHYVQIGPGGLYIDSQKQPEQVFEKYKTLLEKKAGKPMDFTIQYHYNERKKDSSLKQPQPTGNLQDKGVQKHLAAMKRHNELIGLLNTHLEQENLVTSNQPQHIRLTPEGIFINKVQQPEKLFTAYKKIIEQKTGEPFVYTLEYTYKAEN
ncbi:M56 family metallopeptidase [Rhodocytophaga aerolata]|uniref:M56 family metallopeptidase n=1 Tax=Rhodocytophaga aerolata TaxID=455078 RepID=A0ABT8R5Q7_9BACT|nr:M56 family metallopeptidase [Rhodocytophaga aerolata]MDO1446603.1 M56 family metallopeptidase [Rhodocytophaga aerolata]